ncbi:DUF4291 domain-containing protein [Leptospira koniambonensis]|uniref:DUF4291 domain-containing protein n=1 Tax=Leptospira koniambonensis TaxID=2484950 RepID=A0A4R9J4Y5_9LEPT|nr:DUF4291 domain-containing protein [Leptospira koniambonensis]TGL31338.1 DUF4291 domain-containing protein [Leptospira koniambonensis]
MNKIKQKLILQKYNEQRADWPNSGKHIMAQYTDDSIVVYQAFRNEIADYAVSRQHFGGTFSFSRMSWIKPNFLWMMYRCGWASKEGQERVLAVRIKKEGFEKILARAVHSSYSEGIYKSREDWHFAGEKSDVRLQWDPDHDPFGKPLARRAIQLGLRGETLRSYATDWIIEIEDITEMVRESRIYLKEDNLGQLCSPRERVYSPIDQEGSKHIFY